MGLAQLFISFLYKHCNVLYTSVRGVKGLLCLSPLGLISCLLRGQVNLSI